METSKFLTLLLGAGAVLGATGLVLASTNEVTGPFGRVATLIGYSIVLGASLSGAWLELRHKKRAEAFAMVALSFSWIMAMIGGLETQWVLGALQANLTLIAIFVLVERFIEKDIARGERAA